MTKHFEIPIVDFTGVMEGNPAAKKATAKQVREACLVHGFFYLTGHGIPQKFIDNAFAASRKFYSIPDDQKTDVYINQDFRGHAPLTLVTEIGGVKQSGRGETFTFAPELPKNDPSILAKEFMCAPNLWPKAMPEFRDIAYGYYETIAHLGQKILRVLAISLDIPESFFTDKFVKPVSQCVFLHYPPIPDTAEKNAVSGPEHTDWGTLTVLYQDNCGGLQVRDRTAQVWVDAPPIEGHFVVNIGDMVERWSNNRYVSTPHRVINRSGKERYSIATFMNPTSGCVVDPRDWGVSDAECLFPPITSGDYVRGRWEEYYLKKSA